MSVTALLLVLIFCIAPIHCTDKTTTTKPPSDVTLLTTPSDIKCSFQLTGSAIGSFISLTLSRSPVPNEDVFSEVAMVTAFGGNKVDVKDTSIGGVVAGGVYPSESTITFQWHYPNKTAPGKYKCEAFGLDRLGHPVTSAALATVVTESADLTAAIHEIKDLQATRDTCLSQASGWQSTVWGALHQANSTEYNVTGHRYYLSQKMKVNVTYADQVCGILGGYLAEIEDQGEYDFVIEFLGNLSAIGYNQEVQVGGSDLVSEGSWMFPHSGNPVEFFHWATNQPSDGPTDDCLSIYANYVYDRYKRIYVNNVAGSGLYDNCCTGCTEKRFLCEIP